MTILDLNKMLREAEINDENGFLMLQEIGRHVSEGARPEDAQDLVILALDRREEFPQVLHPVIDALVARLGLYPYLAPSDLDDAELLRYEFNRPRHFEEDIVFHQAQSHVYRLLMKGDSVVLSAPTSFGKSLVVDAIIASGKYANLAVIVPTIALLDETRRRLQRFKGTYQIVTHPSQRFGEFNVFVLTQERMLEFRGLPEIDFFVIDEFYKLTPRPGDDRAALLNLALYRLMKTAKAFYLIGPNIQGVAQASVPALNAHLIFSNYRTVTTVFERVPKKDRNIEGLVRICMEQDASSLVYCAAPDSARKAALALAQAQEEVEDQDVRDAAGWVGREYHPDWSFVLCLRKGVGLHHGRIPRALQQMAVRLFDEGKIKYLVCTSTLIEGVNTAAKNVMIFDKRVGTRSVDYFTYANISGRAGRMRRHFVGRVFQFQEPPEENLPEVEIPILSQPDDLSLRMIVGMDDDDLDDGYRERLGHVAQEGGLPVSVLRENLGVDPSAQVELAKRIRGFSDLELSAFAWSGFPNGQQVEDLCELVWSAFFGRKYYGVVSARQLSARLNLASALRIKDWIQHDLAEEGTDPDQAVEGALEFLRQWCGFALPRYVRATERLLQYEQGRRGLPQSYFSVYLSRVESMFLPPMVAALDECGVPAQISGKVHTFKVLPDNLDDAADEVRRAAAEGRLEPFEQRVVENALGLVITGQGLLDFGDEGALDDEI